MISVPLGAFLGVRLGVARRVYRAVVPLGKVVRGWQLRFRWVVWAAAKRRCRCLLRWKIRRWLMLWLRQPWSLPTTGRCTLAAWLWTILVGGESGRAYNVGSPEPVSIAQLAGTVAHALNATAGVRILGTAEPGRPPERYVPSVERARTERGLENWTGLEESIRRTAAFEDADPHG